MKTVKVILSITLATLTGVVAIDAATAQRHRASNVAKGAALTNTPEKTEARHDAHQENQDSREESRDERHKQTSSNQDARQERRKDASPNEKAVTYNVAHSKHQQKVTNQANAAAAVSKRR